MSEKELVNILKLFDEQSTFLGGMINNLTDCISILEKQIADLRTDVDKLIENGGKQ